MGLAVKYIYNLDTTAQELAQKKINEEAFFKKLFDKYQNRSEKSMEQMVEKIHYLYTEKDDLQNFRGSAWGMYNAVSDLISNSVPGRETEFGSHKKLERFFDGNELLETTQELLMVA